MHTTTFRLYAKTRTGTCRFLQTVHLPTLTDVAAYLPRLAHRLHTGEKFRVRVVGY